jgi:hypothetical protein
MENLSATGGAALTKAGCARETRPGTGMVWSNFVGTTSFLPSVICHIPLREMVFLLSELCLHSTNTIALSNSIRKRILFFITNCLFEYFTNLD